MADLIRWHGPQSGGHYSGHAGANDAMLFNIWAPSGTAGDEEWVLTSSLPGQHPGKARSYGTDPDELKPRAEELLREFASSIGAVFPDSAGHDRCRTEINAAAALVIENADRAYELEVRWQALKDWMCERRSIDGGEGHAYRSALARMAELEEGKTW